MAEGHTIETYGRGSYNRNIWPHNSRATAAPARLADSFVLVSPFYPLLTVFNLNRNYNLVFLCTIIKETSCLLFDDYFRTNASVHDHFTSSQFGLHAESYRTSIRVFTVRLHVAGPRALDYGMLLVGLLMSVVNYYIMSLKQLIKNSYLE